MRACYHWVMPYRRATLSLDAPISPPVNMPALGMLGPDAPHLAQKSLDSLVSSCRVLGAWGLQGSGKFSIPDGTNPTYNPGDRLYPDEDTPRVVLRMTSVPLTPGHVVGIDVTALPSGPTQVQFETNDWTESGRGGQIILTVTYSNSDAQTVVATCVVTPTSSVRVYGAETASAHAALEAYSATAAPFGIVASAVDREKFARGGDVLVSFEVSYTGSVRVADFAVVERPAAIIVDTTSSEWPSAMYTQGGAPYDALPSEFPITQLSTADPGGGHVAIRRALEQHGMQLGPCLAWQSSGREGASILTWLDYDDGTGDDEAPAIASSSTSYVMQPYGFAPSAQFPGYQMGNYARQIRDSDAWFDGRTGVLPVWAVVYAKGTSALYKWQTGLTEWSAVVVPITSGASFGWVIRPGWIEVGTAPDDAPVARLLVDDASGGGVVTAWRYAGLFFRQR
jgi:hypothetical protein